MPRLLLGCAPALLLLLAACGGGSTTTTTAPAGTTAAASTTAAPSTTAATSDTGAATASGEVSATPASSGGPPATAPDLPPGTIAIADYYIVPANAQQQASALFTLNITQTIPSGATTTWYTYTGGQWTSLGPATVFGGTPPIAEGSFSPVPTNLIVLASSQ